MDIPDPPSTIYKYHNLDATNESFLFFLLFKQIYLSFFSYPLIVFFCLLLLYS